MHKRWKQDPSSVHASWDIYFSGLTKGLPSKKAYHTLPTLMHIPMEVLPIDVSGFSSAKSVNDHLKELKIEHYGWTKLDLDHEMCFRPGLLPNFVKAGIQTLTIQEIIDTCKRMYCSSISIQYIHIPDHKKCDWLHNRIETPKPFKYTVEEKRTILDCLIWSDSIEHFIASKYPNKKRFGLKGGESLIPSVKTLIDRSIEHSIGSITIGMPHQGHLNVLANVIRQPIEGILHQFASKDDDGKGSGDVKYHLSANYMRPTPSGKKVALSLVANPLHLEAKDPVILGKT
ncbi:2-oxoglutarate dehydrogenase E1 component [Thecaphora frezii]